MPAQRDSGGKRATAKRLAERAEREAASSLAPVDVTAAFAAVQRASDDPEDCSREALLTARAAMRLAAANEAATTTQRIDQVLRAARVTFDAADPEARCAALSADLRDAHAEADRTDERLRLALSEIRDLRAQLAAYAVAHTEGDTAPASGASVQ